MSDENSLVALVTPAKQFAVDSYRLLQKCTKPDAKGERAPARGRRLPLVGPADWAETATGRARIPVADRAGFACADGPDLTGGRAEFKKIAMATTVGFLVMGFLGFFVKLIHIPINQILVGA
jgi:preprotein translocase subunit Sss1